MILKDAVELITIGTRSSSIVQTWADLGCGSGTFTEALAQILPEGSTIYAVDRNKHLLKNIPDSYGKIKVEKSSRNFLESELPDNLDGILMANSLHFVEDKFSFIKKAERYMKPPEIFLIVEYDTEISNPWVPFPLSFISLENLFKKAEFTSVIKINEKPSVFRRAKIYSALISKAEI